MRKQIYPVTYIINAIQFCSSQASNGFPFSPILARAIPIITAKKTSPRIFVPAVHSPEIFICLKGLYSSPFS